MYSLLPLAGYFTIPCQYALHSATRLISRYLTCFYLLRLLVTTSKVFQLKYTLHLKYLKGVKWGNDDETLYDRTSKLKGLHPHHRLQAQCT